MLHLSCRSIPSAIYGTLLLSRRVPPEGQSTQRASWAEQSCEVKGTIHSTVPLSLVRGRCLNAIESELKVLAAINAFQQLRCSRIVPQLRLLLHTKTLCMDHFLNLDQHIDCFINQPHKNEDSHARSPSASPLWSLLVKPRYHGISSSELCSVLRDTEHQVIQATAFIVLHVPQSCRRPTTL